MCRCMEYIHSDIAWGYPCHKTRGPSVSPPNPSLSRPTQFPPLFPSRLLSYPFVPCLLFWRSHSFPSFQPRSLEHQCRTVSRSVWTVTWSQFPTSSRNFCVRLYPPHETNTELPLETEFDGFWRGHDPWPPWPRGGAPITPVVDSLRLRVFVIPYHIWRDGRHLSNELTAYQSVWRCPLSAWSR